MLRKILLGFMGCTLVFLPLWAKPLEIAREGKALVPVIVAEEASPEVRKGAQELAAGLEKITGTAFVVQSGSGEEGIVFGTEGEWPGHLPRSPEGRALSLTRDDYLIRSDGKRLLLLGRTPLGAQNALWDFFHTLGFRQFFPGTTWEIWPKTQPNLSVEVDRYESPSYYTRKIGINIWPEHREAWQTWQVRNRMISGFTLHTGHVYGAIIRNNPEHFAAYPEDIYVPEGRTSGSKLDPSRPSVLEVAAKDALNRLEKNPNLDSISMDPSDGGGWRKDSPLGSPSNQALTLANHVADAVNARYPGMKVGIYAYNEHSPVPDLAVHPQVIVSVATAFLHDGHTPEGLMKGWNEKGAEIGVREYLSVWTWSHDLPGRSRASDLRYIFRTIPEFYQLGARYWITEASAGWGVHGLGNYLASRLLWDVKEGERREALLEDFFTRAFEDAAPEARAFYALLLAENRPLLSEDLLARMYRTLHAALEKTSEPGVVARLLDLVAYTGFVERMFIYQNRQGEERQAAYDEMVRFVYQTRHRHMVDGRGPFGDIPIRDKQIQSAGWFGKEGEHPLKVPGTVSEAQLREMVARGIEAWKPNDFEAVSFEGELVPVNPDEALPEGDLPTIGLRGTQRLYLRGEPGGSTFGFTVKTGYIYTNRGPTRLSLYAEKHAIPDEPVATVEVPPDQELHTVELQTRYSGNHYVEIRTGGALAHIGWPVGQRTVLPASPEERTIPHTGFTGVFFVPKGTGIIGGFTGFPRGRLEDPERETALDFKEIREPGYFSIPVPKGMDDRYWFIRDVRGSKLLLTVPAFYARHPSELLVPESALSKPDARKALSQ